MRVLVTGGAGYIGSVVAAYLIDHGHEVTTFDNLSNGNMSSVDKRSHFITGDILNLNELKKAMVHSEAVVHLAGKISVEESVENPEVYLQNNFEGTKNVLNVMETLNIRKFIFSSTCAVYGEVQNIKINELTNTFPINPYGKSKLMADKEISHRSSLRKIDAVSFRFFNASGAYKSKEGILYGELHKVESHLIPTILQNKTININGSDYPTFDGTCVRDFIHVADIANAIEKALHLDTNGFHKIYNLGSEKGYSILEIVECIEEIIGSEIKRNYLDRRVGDSAILISDNSLVERELDWKPSHSLYQIIQSAIDFHEVGNWKRND
jgi:UDP-glucose 4-epimerase